MTEPPEPQGPISGVYFLAGGGLVKIGKAGNVAMRVNEIRRMSPIPLELVGVIAWSRHSCDVLEKWLHGRYAPLRQHGEWFTPCDEMLAFARGEKTLDTLAPAEIARAVAVPPSLVERLPCIHYLGPNGGIRMLACDYEELALRIDELRAERLALTWLQARIRDVRELGLTGE